MESLPPLSPNLERTVGLAINNRNLDVTIRSPGGTTDNIKIVGWRVLRGPWAGVRWQEGHPNGGSPAGGELWRVTALETATVFGRGVGTS